MLQLNLNSQCSLLHSQCSIFSSSKRSLVWAIDLVHSVKTFFFLSGQRIYNIFFLWIGCHCEHCERPLPGVWWSRSQHHFSWSKDAFVSFLTSSMLSAFDDVHFGLVSSSQFLNAGWFKNTLEALNFHHATNNGACIVHEEPWNWGQFNLSSFMHLTTLLRSNLNNLDDFPVSRWKRAMCPVCNFPMTESFEAVLSQWEGVGNTSLPSCKHHS